MEISGALAAQATTTAEQGVIETSQNTLGQDDFFKLLTTQLTAQDPLEPMQDTEFIAQMAQFSSLSQMEAIAANTEASKVQEEQNAVMALLGKLIQADGLNGEGISGIVNRVELVDGDMVPYIGNTQVVYKTITNISEPSDSTSQSETVDASDSKKENSNPV